jgi:Arc/MetJ-type ribon-helix-helix transcriptional regulator
MPRSKIAISLDEATLARLDILVARAIFPNRSQAIQEAVEEKLARLERSRLARECAKLDQTFEKALWLAVEVETLAKMYVHALAIGEPPCLSEAEMAPVHEQMKRMGYGQGPDLDGVGDVPRAIVGSKWEAH